MNKSDGEHYLQQLGQQLQQRGITGEILISGDVIVLLDIHLLHTSTEKDALGIVRQYILDDDISDETLEAIKRCFS